MIGFPKQLNSREDYDNVVEDFGYTLKTKRAYQGLLNTSKHYVFDRKLGPDEQPDGPEPDYIVMEEEQEDGTVKRTQSKLVENSNGKLFKLGFTVSDVQGVIDKC